MKIQFHLKITLFLIVILLTIFAVPVFAQSGGEPGQAPGSSVAIPSFVLSPGILAAIAGAVLSLAFSYIPGLNTAFAGLGSEFKRLVMVLLLLILSGAMYGLGCGGILQNGLTCDQQGFVQLVWIFILAMMANQSAYQLTPQTIAVKAANGYLIGTQSQTQPLP